MTKSYPINYSEPEHCWVAPFASLYATPADIDYDISAAHYLQQGRFVLLTPDEHSPTAESVFVSMARLDDDVTRKLMSKTRAYVRRTLGVEVDIKDAITLDELKKLEKPHENVKARHVLNVGNAFGGRIELYSVASIRNLVKNKYMPPLPLNVEAMLTERQVLTPLACHTALLKLFERCQSASTPKSQAKLSEKKPVIHFLGSPERVSFIKEVLALRGNFQLHAVNTATLEEDMALKIASNVVNDTNMSLLLTSGSPGFREVLATANINLVKLSELVDPAP